MHSPLTEIIEAYRVLQKLAEKEREYIEDGTLDQVNEVLQLKEKQMAEIDRKCRESDLVFPSTLEGEYKDLYDLIVQVKELQDANVSLMQEKLSFVRKEMQETKSAATVTNNYLKHGNIHQPDPAKFFDKKR